MVPSNLKFDKDESLTPAQLADRAVLQGQVVSSSPAGTTVVPAFKPGVKIVFVAAPDTELGEYLRADRAHSVAQWQDYLGTIPQSRAYRCRKAGLAALLLKEGEEGLAAYHNSASTNSPAYSDLKTAYSRADQVRELLPANEGAAKLRDSGRAGTGARCRQRSRRTAGLQAGAGRAHRGYAHLANARQLTDHALEVDPHFDQGLTLAERYRG